MSWFALELENKLNRRMQEMQSQLDAIKQAVPLIGWQHIETAPKDGTRVIIGSWFNDSWQQCFSHYLPDFECFVGPLENPATHWMPVPKPPEVK